MVLRCAELASSSESSTNRDGCGRVGITKSDGSARLSVLPPPELGDCTAGILPLPSCRPAAALSHACGGCGSPGGLCGVLALWGPPGTPFGIGWRTADAGEWHGSGCLGGGSSCWRHLLPRPICMAVGIPGDAGRNILNTRGSTALIVTQMIGSRRSHGQ
jgi:hypothetical protein